MRHRSDKTNRRINSPPPPKSLTIDQAVAAERWRNPTGLTVREEIGTRLVPASSRNNQHKT